MPGVSTLLCSYSIHHHSCIEQKNIVQNMFRYIFSIVLELLKFPERMIL